MTVSSSDQSGAGRSAFESERAYSSDSSTNSTGAISSSAMPSSTASTAVSSLFWRNGLRTITFAAASGPTSRGSSCVPPQPGMIESATSGEADVAHVRGDRPRVAVERELEAAAEARAVDRRHRRERQRADARKQLVAGARPLERLLRRPNLRELVDVGADAEDERLAGEHRRGPVAALELVDDGDRRLERGAAERRRRPVVLAVVDRDERDRPARFSLKTVSANVLPEDRCAHPHADAERGEPVPAAALAQAVRELRDEADAGRGERMPDAIAPPYGLRRGSSAATQLVAPREHLHGERLVQLEEVDIVEAKARLLEHALRRRHRPDAHEVRLDAGVP